MNQSTFLYFRNPQSWLFLINNAVDHNEISGERDAGGLFLNRISNPKIILNSNRTKSRSNLILFNQIYHKMPLV